MAKVILQISKIDIFSIMDLVKCIKKEVYGVVPWIRKCNRINNISRSINGNIVTHTCQKYLQNFEETPEILGGLKRF